MTRRQLQEGGFTAVELLITLFIAVAFLGTAYQLYTAVIRDSAEARFRAKASNIAYAELRKWSDDTTPGCTARPEQAFTIAAGHGLDNPLGKVTIECRLDNLTYVKTSVAYGPTANRKEVQHAVYVSK